MSEYTGLWDKDKFEPMCFSCGHPQHEHWDGTTIDAGKIRLCPDGNSIIAQENGWHWVFKSSMHDEITG